jgi:hypothetical protein
MTYLAQRPPQFFNELGESRTFPYPLVQVLGPSCRRFWRGRGSLASQSPSREAGRFLRKPQT